MRKDNYIRPKIEKDKTFHYNKYVIMGKMSILWKLEKDRELWF